MQEIHTENIFFPKNKNELRQWYEENVLSQKEVWIPILCKTTSDSMNEENEESTQEIRSSKCSIPYIDAVEVALCFGWIDSVRRRHEEFCFQRFSPRRKGSLWTELNKERCRRLIKLGLMTPHGEKVLPDLDKNSFHVEEWILQALQKDKVVWKNFISFPELYQRVKLYNIQFEEKKGRHESSLLRLKKLVDATRIGKMFGEWNDGGRLIDY
ncbi:MAG TPA: thymidylate synthase [Porphyromonadaceae bacterium]|nr:thymidylate synthase [Porphyromonadaceae bacterium]